MPLNVVIAPDKFKGTLTATEAAEAIARGWLGARPTDRLHLLPITDGGDGFGPVLSGLLKAKPQTIRTVDAAHRECSALWWWEPGTKTAIIESANVIGLAMLPPGKFHPYGLDTFGLGAVIQAAAAKGARRCLIGIGGSATNDGGFGLAQALGWKFMDAGQNLIERWTDLHRLAKIQAPAQKLRINELIVAVDVQNPLLGPRGATRVYGPQKGLRPAELAIAEANLRKLAGVVSGKGGHSATPGAGAAGGLGFGFSALLGARLTPGFELFSKYADLKKQLAGADLVITGEGCLDRSTLMGKGVGGLAKRCRQLKIPCIALAGNISEPTSLKSFFTHAAALTRYTSTARARAKPAHWLEHLARKTAEQLVLQELSCAPPLRPGIRPGVIQK